MYYNQYIGDRYVPKIHKFNDNTAEWTQDKANNTEFESLEVVTYEGNSFTSMLPVPQGIPITDRNFWIQSADYNAQLIIYQNNVTDQLSAFNDSISQITKIVKSNGVDDTDNIETALESGYQVKLCDTVYYLSRPLKMYNSIMGNGRNKTTIKPTTTFTGNCMLDFYTMPDNTNISDITFDGNFKPIQIIGSTSPSGDYTGGANHLFTSVNFIQTSPNIYAVGGDNINNLQGLLTGSIFEKCHWINCPNPINIGNLQDDIKFDGCRIGGVDNNIPSTVPPIKITGNNSSFNNCYFYITPIDFEYFGYKYFIQVYADATKTFNNCFWESNNTNITHIFYCDSPDLLLRITDSSIRISGDNYISAFIYCNITNSDQRNKTIQVTNVFNTSPILNCILDCYAGGTGITQMLNLLVNGVDSFTNLYKYVGNSSTYNNSALLISGTYNKTTYNHYANSQTTTLIPINNDNTKTNYTINAIANTAPTFDFTLPSNGTYLISAIVRGENNSIDHSARLVAIAYYSKDINTILSCEQIGTTQKCGGAISLTIGNPDSTGKITLSFTQTNSTISIANVQTTLISTM